MGQATPIRHEYPERDRRRTAPAVGPVILRPRVPAIVLFGMVAGTTLGAFIGAAVGVIIK